MTFIVCFLNTGWLQGVRCIFQADWHSLGRVSKPPRQRISALRDLKCTLVQAAMIPQSRSEI